jgi:hypothetical protein
LNGGRAEERWADKPILSAPNSSYKATVKTVKSEWKLTRLDSCIRFNQNLFLTILESFHADKWPQTAISIGTPQGWEHA